MSAFLGYSSFLVLQIIIAIGISRDLGLTESGMYYFILAIVTPISNFLSFGIKQKMLIASERDLANYLLLRVLFCIVTVLLSLALWLFWVDSSYGGFLLLISALKMYEWSGELSVGTALKRKNHIYFFSNSMVAFALLFMYSLKLQPESIYKIALPILLLVMMSLMSVNSYRLLGSAYSLGKDWFIRNLAGFLYSGSGLLVMALSASLGRIYVEYAGGAVALGVYGNILYGYVLGLLVVNVVAVKLHVIDKTRMRLLILICLLVLIFAVYLGVLFFGGQILGIIFGKSMIPYGWYLTILYPFLCVSLIASLGDYFMINHLPSRYFLYSNIFVLITVLFTSLVLYRLKDVDALLGGAYLLAVSSVVKLVTQLYMYRVNRYGNE